MGGNKIHLITLTNLLLFLITVILLVICIKILLIRKHYENNDFEKSFYILNQIIELARPGYQQSIIAASKKYTILSPSGSESHPNDSIIKYKELKSKISSSWAKKVVKSLNKDALKEILRFYSHTGFINYILSELKKEV